MKRLSFVYEVKARLQLTAEELEHISHQSAHHYDRTCRAASQVGGFLYGMKNCLEGGLTDWDLSSREIDLMLKILEQPGSDGQLLEKLITVFREVVAEWKSVSGSSDQTEPAGS